MANKKVETKKEEITTAVENSPNPVVKEMAIPKKERKPKEKVRPIEEIRLLPTSKLTDKEKDRLIKELKEQNTLINNQISAYKETIDAAFKQTREIEAKYDAMEMFYRKKLKYVDTQTSAFCAAINEAIKGGIN